MLLVREVSTDPFLGIKKETTTADIVVSVHTSAYAF
jgi:hypothetical protein